MNSSLTFEGKPPKALNAYAATFADAVLLRQSARQTTRLMS